MTGKISFPTLRDNLKGALLLPGDDGYDSARRIFNAEIDRRPAAIAQCTGVADVLACVRFAREHDVEVTVRSGGHGVAGKAVADGALMIDLSPMKGIRVDPARRVGCAQAGVTLGEFDRETQALGLATTLGVVSATGLAGLTLGGGLGWLQGKHGLACDNLIAADVVTADGRLVTASATENSDLLWGLRGGSGNFGVVTSFEFQLHPLDSVVAGMILHPISKAKEVLTFYRQFTSNLPDELTVFLAMVTAPDGTPVAAIVPCYAGAPEQGEKLLRPLREFGPPIADMAQPKPYTEHQQMLDASLPPGQHHYWKAEFLKDLSAEAIVAMLPFVHPLPTPYCQVIVEHIHGAAARVKPDATAFPHRGVAYNFGFISAWEKPADGEKCMNWAREFWKAMSRFSTSRAYVNYLSEGAGEEGVRAAYGANYERLASLKAKYDPTNFFRVNQNIRPAARASA